MSENEKKAKAKDDEMSLEEARDILAAGKLELIQPIHLNGSEVTSLPYNLKKVTGMEYLEALDSDTATRKGAYNLSAKQALNLFLAGVLHGDNGINGSDLPDLRKQLDIQDVQQAVMAAVGFFNASSRVGTGRISRS